MDEVTKKFHPNMTYNKGEENENENVEKQDCELRAFYRMAKRIKKEYPKLPIIEHIYSNNYNAMKAHYFFIQFAHTIRQLLEKGLKYIKELKMSVKEVSADITQALTHTIANLTQHYALKKKNVFRNVKNKYDFSIVQ